MDPVLCCFGNRDFPSRRRATGSIAETPTGTFKGGGPHIDGKGIAPTGDASCAVPNKTSIPPEKANHNHVGAVQNSLPTGSEVPCKRGTFASRSSVFIMKISYRRPGPAPPVDSGVTNTRKQANSTDYIRENFFDERARRTK
ncbi:hypothetical protein CIHG_02625 [Coccidioides immitis H538.4]|uniref:Uncharacterized protein n=2 Tax=Coccidioides immitis TaxID=5501 RepID=A0A0J8RJK3_COCIT|nr:hypothetical protein CIRG_02952 [Coccidioides immitis RMSCC 2394]KMU84841.1 hypothetical protein CIHG_02625 [Coccidioides immitis H538.4]